ncbi:MAG: methyltransferase domain-containing protein [Gammaproteobacteria bacterium]|nr:methyltransferase domain-containing protein [Rhodocyclaceae bacterium]MBU3908119.1 methyltransferase domain-containing protein [Gammaproteobacteria bacterium]MBU4005760.1 methyltransferase domain-containing protein [Gammaproteobacteria bacterium]MBU4021492.1 methyltransferase domain-containing protein [Gammaproteobacteria bacterium]MBU4097320.1 methyltransferase domain-containing protein [Gammaproteobacteria bacterium]
MKPEVMETWPEHAAAHNTHSIMFDLIARHVGNVAGVAICDIPCGAGLFSRRLADAGMQVTAMDIEAVEPYLFDASRRVLGDANQGLPFESAKFDSLVSIEGIEHLENPSGFLRECARVVKPGGWIFLSTPNVDGFRSRKYVLLRGYHRFFGPQGDRSKDSGHLLPIDMIFFRGAAARAGLEIIDIKVNDLSGKNWVKEWLRKILMCRLPVSMRGEIPFYGDVIIYALRKLD